MQLLALAALGFSIVPSAFAAGPTITGDLTMVINYPTDHHTGHHGPQLGLLMYVSHPNGLAGFQGPLVAASAENLNNNNYPFPNPTPLTTFYWNTYDQAFVGLLPITAAQLTQIEGRYRYRVTDAFGQTDQHTSHNLNKPEIIALPTNLAVSNQTTTPVFTFTDPVPDPEPTGLYRVYNLLVIEAATGNNVALLPQPGGSSPTPQIAIPPGVLCPCRDYYLRGQTHDIDNADDEVENMAIQDMPFMPLGSSPNGDLNGDCMTNGRDIQSFVNALLGSVTDARTLCAGDSNGGGTIDIGDIPGLVSKLLNP